MGSVDTASEDGRRTSSVYEVNLWLAHWRTQATPDSGGDYRKEGCCARETRGVRLVCDARQS